MIRCKPDEATYRIIATGSRWSFKRYAVQKLTTFLGLAVCWSVHYGDSIEDCREYVEQALRLPEYYRDDA